MRPGHFKYQPIFLISIHKGQKHISFRRKSKKGQRNYSEHILRMPIYRIIRKLCESHSKGRRETG